MGQKPTTSNPLAKVVFPRSKLSATYRPAIVMLTPRAAAATQVVGLISFFDFDIRPDGFRSVWQLLVQTARSRKANTGSKVNLPWRWIALPANRV
jgi:hypothetical protein